MAVTVALPGVLRQTVGDQSTVEVQVAGTVRLGEVLDVLADRYPALERRLRDESGRLRRYVNFYVDGEECRHLGCAAAPVTDGAEVRIIPSVAGG
jgi:sulfur-carrier protein